MNTLRGLGACAVLAAIAYTVSKATNVDMVVIGFTVAAVALTVLGWLLSIRRRRHDRRVARGRTTRSRRT